MNTQRRVVALGDLFTDQEIKRAAELFERAQPGTFCTTVVREVITPEVLARIDQRLGQKNDARYWGYALEHAMMQSQKAHA